MDPNVPMILEGDINLICDHAVDCQGSHVDHDSNESSVALARLFTNCCCVHVWRHLFPSRPGFTWTRNDGVVSSRIDLNGCATVWVPFISSRDLLPCPAHLLTIAICISRYLCPTLPLLVLACGSLISRFWDRMIIAS